MKKTVLGLIAITVLAGAAVWTDRLNALPLTPPLSPVQQPIQVAQNPNAEGWTIPNHDVRPGKASTVEPVVGDDGEPVVQVVLLLDTSGSMSPLIDQAKTELWSVVNRLGESRYKGRTPKVEVALYEYGKSSIAADEGYLRMLAPFTNDLDGVSEILFALDTNGGEEYASWAIRSALQSLKWKERDGSLRMIFVAGNEAFDQGPVGVDKVMGQANEKGVLVYPIYCDAGYSSDRPSWQRASLLAKTDLKVIDHTRVVKVPKTPYDDEISSLGRKLNSTYVGYGEKAERRARLQSGQDQEVARLGAGVSAERSVAKASASYDNSSWDLVDAYRANPQALQELAPSALPQELRERSEAEQKAYIETKASERAAIQARIQELNRERQEFLAKHQEQSSGGATLGQAIVTSVKQQAGQQGFDL